MIVENIVIKSKNLREDFEIKKYGHSGKGVIVFPCSQGRFFDYENFGMIEILKPYILSAEICLFTVDGRDSHSWFHQNKDSQMGINHRNYELCITEEVIPLLRKKFDIKNKFCTTGNSWGGFHSMNFLLKFPEIFDCAISLSGVYSLSSLLGNYFDQNVYYNDVLKYFPNLNDGKILEQLRKSFVILSYGKGLWEDHKHECDEVVKLLHEKEIPYLFDPWGPEWNHDWPTWKAQIVKYFDVLREKKII